MKKEEFYKEAIPGSKGPLEGIKVLEATTTQAGPVAGALLSDLGAESIKVDAPKTGEMGRYIPPFLGDAPNLENSIYYLTYNRNKKCITLTLNRPEGQEVFRELARHMDIIIQNYKPGTMDKWGLGYEDIRRLKSDIIYVSISGYGQYGPYHTKPAYDPVGQAMGGLMYITGPADGPPTKTGGPIADNLTGWQGALGALAALHYRNVTGKGQHVDVAMVDSLLNVSDWGIPLATNLNQVWQRQGNAYYPIGLDPVVKCQDEYIVFLIALDSHWNRFCKLMGREDLIEDSRTKSMVARAENAALVNQIIREWAQDKPAARVLEILEKADLVGAPVLNFKQIAENVHIRERDMVAEVEHPICGKVNIYGVATKYSLTPARMKSAAPLLGQHNQDIYETLLGYGPKKLAQLKEKGII